MSKTTKGTMRDDPQLQKVLLRWEETQARFYRSLDFSRLPIIAHERGIACDKKTAEAIVVALVQADSQIFVEEWNKQLGEGGLIQEEEKPESNPIRQSLLARKYAEVYLKVKEFNKDPDELLVANTAGAVAHSELTKLVNWLKLMKQEMTDEAIALAKKLILKGP